MLESVPNMWRILSIFLSKERFDEDSGGKSRQGVQSIFSRLTLPLPFCTYLLVDASFYVMMEPRVMAALRQTFTKGYKMI